MAREPLPVGGYPLCWWSAEGTRATLSFVLVTMEVLATQVRRFLQTQHALFVEVVAGERLGAASVGFVRSFLHGAERGGGLAW